MDTNQIDSEKFRNLLSSDDEQYILLALQIAHHNPTMLMSCKEQILYILIFIDNEEVIEMLLKLIKPLISGKFADLVHQINKSFSKYDFQYYGFFKKLCDDPDLNPEVLFNLYLSSVERGHSDIIEYAWLNGIAINHYQAQKINDLVLTYHPSFDFNLVDFVIFSNLTSLELTGGFTYMPSGVGKLTKLKQLKFSDNLIEEIPEDFFQNLHQLAVLKGENNQLTSLPNSIGHCKKLEFIDFKNNQIKYLPLSFCQLSNLEVIDFENNYLLDLPKEIGDLKELRKLNLQDNCITALPDSFRNLQKLEEFRLLPNELEIPEWMYELPVLDILSVAQADNKDLTHLEFHSLDFMEIYEGEPDINNLKEERGIDEIYFSGLEEMQEKLLTNDFYHTAFFNSINWEIIEDVIDSGDDDYMDAIHLQFPGLRKYRRFFTDENLFIQFWCDIFLEDDDY